MFNEIEIIENMITNLSGEYAYYMNDNDNFNTDDILEWLDHVYSSRKTL